MLFVDTAFLIALFRGKDEDHARAVQLFSAVDEDLVSSDHVIAEFLTFIAGRDGNQVAYERGTKLLSSDLQIVYVTADEMLPALEKVRTLRKLSMCDALSAVVMQKLGIRKILSFDSDFDRLGFERLH